MAAATSADRTLRSVFPVWSKTSGRGRVLSDSGSGGGVSVWVQWASAAIPSAEASASRCQDA